MICSRCLEVNPCDCDCHNNTLIFSDHKYVKIQAGYSDEEFKLAQINEYKKRFGDEKGEKLYEENLK